MSELSGDRARAPFGGFACRSAKAADAEAMDSLLDAAVSARRGDAHERSTVILGEIKHALGEPSTWSQLVFDGNLLVGYAIGTPAKDPETKAVIPNRQHLSLLMVRPEYWGNKLGYDLLGWTKAEALRRGAHSISLWTEISNDRSNPLYAHNGYQLTGEQRANPITGELQAQYILNVK